MNATFPLPSRVCAIVVTYHPSPGILDNIAALRPEVEQVFVIDNGSSGPSLGYLQALDRSPQCHVRFNAANRGIAAAMNQGVSLAAEGGFDWVITFDQDSAVKPGFVSAMLADYDSRSNRDRIGVLSPRYIDRLSGNVMTPVFGRDGNLQTSMTSGSMMPVKVLAECGGFDEALFMDYVDIEFCLRVRDHGYRIVECPAAVLVHSLGKLRYYKFMGRRFQSTHHNAARRYYITRNRIWLYRKYRQTHREWFGYDSAACLKEFIKMLLLESDRWAKLRSVFLGVSDALAGRMGETLSLEPEQGSGGRNRS
jgi:rhamnosyltransferase